MFFLNFDYHFIIVNFIFYISSNSSKFIISGSEALLEVRVIIDLNCSGGEVNHYFDK